MSANTLKKLIDDVFFVIIQENSQFKIEAIPQSDELIKKIGSAYGYSDADIKRALRILIETHKILAIEMVKEHKEKNIKKIEGYVETEPETLYRLKNYYQTILQEEYQKQNRSQLMVGQIIKEVYNNIGRYQNTAIGQLTNKVIMLEEYSKLVDKNLTEYSKKWKDDKIKEVLREEEERETKKSEEEEPEAEAPENKKTDDASQRRAVDSDQYDDYSTANKKYPLEKILQIYGVNFFYRVNLRKYNFEILIDVVEKRIINRKNDLTLLKQMLKKVKANIERDPKLKEYRDEISKLERALLRHIPYSYS